MANKLLMVSRRYLPPFLRYRENPGGGRISAGRAKRLSDLCGSETRQDFIRRKVCRRNSLFVIYCVDDARPTYMATRSARSGLPRHHEAGEEELVT